MNNNLTIPVLLEEAVKKNPHAPALEFEGHTFSYQELWKEVEKYKNMLESVLRKSFERKREKGAISGTRIAILMPNIPQFVFAYYGALQLGCIPVAISLTSIFSALRSGTKVNKIDLPPEMRDELRVADFEVIVVADFLYPLVAQMEERDLSGKVILVTSPSETLPVWKKVVYPAFALMHGRHVTVKEEWGDNHAVLTTAHLLKENNPHVSGAMKANPDSIAQIQFTGGTTGTRKGAMLTHRNVIENILACREHLRDYLKEGDAVLGILPLYHSFGIFCMNLTLLSLHGKFVLHVLQKRIDAKEIFRKIEHEKIAILPGVNAIFVALAAADPSKYNLSSLRFCFYGAGPLDPSAKETFEQKTNAKVGGGYGLSENSPVVSVLLPDENKQGSVGRPIPGITVEITDVDTGLPRGVNEEGEIVVSGESVMQGYFRNEEASKEILRNGKLYTGDIGRMDEDGFLYITDRKKDMAKIFSENVYPRQVEEFVIGTGLISKCAVVGVPDSKRGEALVLFAVPSDKTLDESVEKLSQDVMRLEYPNHLWRPREVYIVPDETFAEWVDPMGKVLKRKVKQFYRDIQAAKHHMEILERKKKEKE
ncbi:AMP-binding protein [bacterium]|nr:AMP-binding protein [bacterium]